MCKCLKLETFFFPYPVSLYIFSSSSSSPCTHSPHRFPTTDNFQRPQQSLEIPQQYLVVEVSTAWSSSMKCLWNSGVCLSRVYWAALGWGEGVMVCVQNHNSHPRYVVWSRSVFKELVWVRRETFLLSVVRKTFLLPLALNTEPHFRGQVRFTLAYFPLKWFMNMPYWCIILLLHQHEVKKKI